MMDQVELLTGLRQVNRINILPRVKALAITSCIDLIGYLIAIGFDEHSTDTLYNSDNCRDIFSLFIIVVLHRFMESQEEKHDAIRMIDRDRGVDPYKSCV